MKAPPKEIAVFFADAHLQRRAWSGRPIEGDAYCSFEQIVDYAIAHDLAAVFGAGDLIDRQLNRSDPIVFLCQQLDRLEQAKVAFYFLQGQHELEDTPWFSAHRWAEHLHNKFVQIGPHVVYGLDFQPAGDLQEALATIPSHATLLLAHQVWSEFMGSVASPQGNMGDVPVVSTVFSGDYHVQDTVASRGKDGQRIKLISPGATCMQSIDETEYKFFYVLSADGSFEAKPLKTRRVIRWEPLTREDGVEQLVRTVNADLDLDLDLDADAKLPEAIRKPLLQVTYGYQLDGVVRRVIAAVGDRANLFFKEIPPEPAPETVARREARGVSGLARAATLEGELPAYLETAGLSYLRDDCLRLLQAEDPAGELRRMREEALL